MDILDQIIAHKRAAELPLLPPLDRAALRELPPTRSLRDALRRPPGSPIHVLAECKQASPSKGLLVSNYDPVRQAFSYIHGGASGISVLTDERFFQGHLDHLIAVRAISPIPIIRKDFIIDQRQIAQARLAGADAVLLIVACLSDGLLRDLHGFASELGLSVLVEVHDEDEAVRAVALGRDLDLVGVNNRSLKTFAVNLNTTIELLPGLQAPGRVVVAESGISTRADCQLLEVAGVDAVLVGEHLMKTADPATALHSLRGTVARSVLA